MKKRDPLSGFNFLRLMSVEDMSSLSWTHMELKLQKKKTFVKHSLPSSLSPSLSFFLPLFPSFSLSLFFFLQLSLSITALSLQSCVEDLPIWKLSKLYFYGSAGYELKNVAVSKIEISVFNAVIGTEIAKK